MNPISQKDLEQQRFTGFVTFDALRASRLSAVPCAEGVYVVLRVKADAPVFRPLSTGGWFKGKDPAIPIAKLEEKWVENAQIVYIGKAPLNKAGKRGLRNRLYEYADFGAGKPVGHWGGRYIWQLADAAELLVAWRPCAASVTAKSDEADLVSEFCNGHGGRLPFANINHPRA